MHAGSESASEQLTELHALLKEDLTPRERLCVRSSIEQHKLGTNKTLLRQVGAPLRALLGSRSCPWRALPVRGPGAGPASARGTVRFPAKPSLPLRADPARQTEPPSSLRGCALSQAYPGSEEVGTHSWQVK